MKSLTIIVLVHICEEFIHLIVERITFHHLLPADQTVTILVNAGEGLLYIVDVAVLGPERNGYNDLKETMKTCALDSVLEILF